MAYDGYYLTYKADKETNERFDQIQKKYPFFRMVKINLEDFENPKVEEAINKIASIANTKHFWVVDPDVKVNDGFDFSFETDNYDDNITHLWNCDERNVFRTVVGVKLFKTKDVKSKNKSHIKDAYYLTGEYKEHETEKVSYQPTTETYDIFYWDKGYGHKQFNKLQEDYSVNIITGETSVDVHTKCREQARTDFYYLVMPNTNIYDSFNGTVPGQSLMPSKIGYTDNSGWLSAAIDSIPVSLGQKFFISVKFADDTYSVPFDNNSPSAGNSYYSTDGINFSDVLSSYGNANIRAKISTDRFLALNDKPVMPKNIKLFSNFPNPFNPVTNISYNLSSKGKVKVTIHDMLGRIVTTLIDRSQNAGFNSITWNGTNIKNELVAGGVYIYTIQFDKSAISKKMVLLK